jgi:hypothetical protein
MLVFQGDDPEAKIRYKEQQRQLAEWASKDIKTKQEMQKAEEAANRMYEQQLLALEQRTLQLQKEHEEAKRVRVKERHDHNRTLVCCTYFYSYQH